jgi:hypothetical protein
MGNGIFFNHCCNKQDDKINNKINDIDINKDNNNNDSTALKDLHTQRKQNKNNKYDDITKTDIKSKKSKENQFTNTFKRRNLTQGGSKRNSDFIQNQNISLFNNTFQILKNNQYISISNMNLIKNNLNNRVYNSYFNSQLGKNSSFYFSSSNDKFESNFQSIKTTLKLSGELFCNKILEINKFGLKNSIKKVQDGIISFGIKHQDEPPNNNIKYKFDYILEEKIINKINKKQKHNSGKIFDILLDKKDKNFVLFYAHSSLLLYYKIKNKLNLEYDKDYYLILGSIFLSINIKKSLKIKINIQVELENEKSQKYSFEIKDMPIKIGRSHCTINIQKPSISKLHGSIDYEGDNFFYNDENSTNGSTLLIKEDDFLKIKGKMNFKLEDIAFTIKENTHENENDNLINTNNDEDFDEDEDDEEDNEK